MLSVPLARYLREDGEELVVLLQCADGTSGHPGILHGGITSLIFDEVLYKLRKG